MTTVTPYTKTATPAGAVLPGLTGGAVLDRPVLDQPIFDQPRRRSERKSRRQPEPRPQPSKKSPARKPTTNRQWRSDVNWGVVGWLVLLHGGAIAAPFFFSWEALLLTFALHWFTGGIGI